MLMGGRAQGLRSRVVLTSCTSALSVCSVAPGNFLIFHTCRQEGRGRRGESDQPPEAQGTDQTPRANQE
jgi:hypothetical protein